MEPLDAGLASDPERSRCLDPVGQLDRPNQDRRRASRRLGHDVQTGVHAVHKVQVGAARLAVHDGVPGGSPEPGVRGSVVFPDVRLDLDDPAGDPAELGIVGDEPAAEQVASDLEGRTLEERPRERPAGAQVRG